MVSHNFAERRRLRCPLPAPDGVPSAAAASRQRGGGGAPWQGFAGLPQTVVERLLEEGAGVGLPADTTTAECLADVRHVMGGGCCAGERYEAALADVAAGVAEAARHVCAAGGGGSELSHVLERAHACVDGGRERRLARPASDWEALRCVLACAVPAPEWLSPDDAALRVTLTKKVLAVWGGVLAAAEAALGASSSREIHCASVPFSEHMSYTMTRPRARTTMHCRRETWLCAASHI